MSDVPPLPELRFAEIPATAQPRYTGDPRHFVKVECLACGRHDELIPASALLQGLRLPPFTSVVDLQPRLRCRECDQRRAAVVSIKRAARSVRSPLLVEKPASN